VQTDRHDQGDGGHQQQRQQPERREQADSSRAIRIGYREAAKGKPDRRTRQQRGGERGRGQAGPMHGVFCVWRGGGR
jgi:hypothetical protein